MPELLRLRSAVRVERTHYLSTARSRYIVEEGKWIVLGDVGRRIGGRAN